MYPKPIYDLSGCVDARRSENMTAASAWALSELRAECVIDSCRARDGHIAHARSLPAATTVRPPHACPRSWKPYSVASGNTSSAVAAEGGLITWGGAPTYGELGYGETEVREGYDTALCDWCVHVRAARSHGMRLAVAFRAASRHHYLMRCRHGRRRSRSSWTCLPVRVSSPSHVASPRRWRCSMSRLPIRKVSTSRGRVAPGALVLHPAQRVKGRVPPLRGQTYTPPAPAACTCAWRRRGWPPASRPWP